MLVALDKIFAEDPSPYVLLDRDLTMIWANAAYLRATGLARDEVVGRRMFDVFPAEAESIPDQMLRASLRRAVEQGRPDHLPLIPYPIRNQDGRMEERFWSATNTPIKDAEGHVEFILQNTNDITALYREDRTSSQPNDQARMLQRAEAVTRQNLELGSAVDFFRSAIDQAPSFMAVLDGRDHVFRIVNQAYHQLVGRRDLLNRTVREALPELDGQGFFELLDEVFLTGLAFTRLAAPVLLRRGPEIERSFVDFIMCPLRGPDGQVRGVFVEGHDVTRQKIAEAEVIETRERFRTMAQTMPNHVWTATPEGRLDWLNDRLLDYCGRTEADLIGLPPMAIVRPEDRPQAEAAWVQSLAQGTAFERELRIRRHDGADRWHLSRALPIRDDQGRILRWIGTNTDIEDRKVAEEAIAGLNAALEERVQQRNRELEEMSDTLRQSQKMEAIGNLAGGIAHDFNNLLQTITGSIQLSLRALDEDHAARPRLDQALRAVERGATLASQLLAFGRRQPLAPRVINLGRLLRDADHIVRSAVGEGVEVETLVAGGLWNTCVDPANVETAILNLAINARDAMEGRGRLTIEIGNSFLDDSYTRGHPDLEPGQYVMLAVTDTGCGMSPEVIERVFEPFFTTKAEGRGTGLGMSMVYGFVKQSGGHVKIYSELGNGTSIKIYLPRSLEAEDAMRPLDTGPMTGGTETILLVEDDEQVRSTAAGLLQDLGYSVLQAKDADRALTIVESGARIDLLFTDVVMPGKLTSRQLAEKTRGLRPGLPVLFTSGYTQNSIVHGGRLDSGVHLLSKPYTQEALARKIREVLVSGASGPPEEDGLKNIHVLVCEDDVIIRMNLVEGLTEAGCRVSQAGSGEAALSVLQHGAADLLLVDLGLPDMSGVDLARAARALHPDLPILFATGDSRVPDEEFRPRVAVLAKPFGDEALLDGVARLVGRRPHLTMNSA
ncbi:PAS domain-containing protein [Cereibacter sphaeroides]|jgi:PAS domain S-box-containing protein|uniref:hybrid sensor histidine kinase/response regulator n=1 Tax=Cereibacter sphaeroides TaxID=1063 RepID=UPI0000663EC1|nr:PAS/PAC sensor hybrid histidine kinase [Cereibacter sphaeroides ATCC 17029]